jgi:hypothetical protein
MMKYDGFIDINRPMKLVSELFANPKYLHEYQDGFIRKELVDGNEGEAGAVSKMYYKNGNRDMELIETITQNNLPFSYAATYQHQHLDNTMKCTFTALNDTQTRYSYEYGYTRIAWIVPRLMTVLFPGMFRKQGEKWIQQFKEFVERQ